MQSDTTYITLWIDYTFNPSRTNTAQACEQAAQEP